MRERDSRRPEKKPTAVLDRIRKVLIERLGFDEAKVVPKAGQSSDLEFDELDLVELIKALEEEFGIWENSEEDVKKIHNIEDLARLLESKGLSAPSDATAGSEAANKKTKETISSEAQSRLVGDMMVLYQRIKQMAIDLSARENLPIKHFHVNVSPYHEEERSEVVIRVFLATTQDQALRYWDSLGKRIERWQEDLPKDAQRLLREDVGVFVEW